MKQQTVYNVQLVGTLIGGMLINTPIAVAWYYGNLSTYIDSYYIATVGKDKHTTGSLWMTASWSSALSIGVLLSGVISNKIGARLTLLAGIVIFNLGIYTSFFTLQAGFWSLHITFAAVTGIGTGFCYSMTLSYAAKWLKKRVGLGSAIVSSCLGGGSLFFNLATTFYINPHNLEADINVGESRYFSQDEIINRVPYVFFVLGAITTGCHVIAFPLMRNHPDFDTNINTQKSDSKSSLNTNVCVNGTDSSINSPEQYGATESVDLYSINNGQHEKWMHGNAETGQNNESVVSKGQTTSAGFTPLQALQTKNFYLLGISLALVMVGFVIENNYYKQYGILYISDDYFLANIGVGISVVVAFSRILWGLTLDKFNVKSVLIFVSSSHAILSAFWYFTPFVNKWLYLIWTLVLQASQSGSMIIFPVSILKLYGPAHYTTIYGLMLLFGIVVYFGIPSLAQLILTQLGWNWLFFFVSATSFTALILNISISS